MAEATTAKYEHLKVEVEFVPSSGTFATICGMKGATVNRTKQIDEDEVADCSDESVAFNVTRETRSRQVTISGTGHWSVEAHDEMLNWYYGSPAEELNVRIRHVHPSLAVGDIEIESGLATLSSLSNDKVKGKRVTADIEIVFSTVPSTTDKA